MFDILHTEPAFQDTSSNGVWLNGDRGRKKDLVQALGLALSYFRGEPGELAWRSHLHAFEA